MNSHQAGPRSLREIELAVEAEGREWMRKRLQQELQKEADLHGGVFPPKPSKAGAPAKSQDADADGERGG